MQCHEFDELRFDVRVYDCTYFLRATTVQEKQQWIEVIEANKVRCVCGGGGDGGVVKRVGSGCMCVVSWRNLMMGTQAVKSPLCMLGGWILCVLHSGVKLIELIRLVHWVGVLSQVFTLPSVQSLYYERALGTQCVGLL